MSFDKRLQLLKRLFPTLKESELVAALGEIDDNILEMLGRRAEAILF